MTMRRLFRILGTVMAVAGVGVLIWVLVVWRWQDPFTALYTTWKQHQLSQSYDKRAASFRAAMTIEMFGKASAPAPASASASFTGLDRRTGRGRSLAQTTRRAGYPMYT